MCRVTSVGLGPKRPWTGMRVTSLSAAKWSRWPCEASCRRECGTLTFGFFARRRHQPQAATIPDNYGCNGWRFRRSQLCLQTPANPALYVLKPVMPYDCFVLQFTTLLAMRQVSAQDLAREFKTLLSLGGLPTCGFPSKSASASYKLYCLFTTQNRAGRAAVRCSPLKRAWFPPT